MAGVEFRVQQGDGTGVKSALRLRMEGRPESDARRGHASVVVGLAAGLAFLFGVGAAFEFIELTTAVHAGSALAAAGGITAFLADE